jgi:hypothetical protein
MSSEALDASKFEEPAKALVRREWRAAASSLAGIAATAASGNPCVGIATGAGVEWLWASNRSALRIFRVETDGRTDRIVI